MTMLGSGVLIPAPTVIADLMALIRLVEDPAAAKENLAKLIAAQEQLAAQAADLELREKTLADGEAAFAAASKKLIADQAAVAKAREAAGRVLSVLER